MLMPLPSTLRRLLTEYETLLAATGTAPPSQRLRDLDYTLCVSTGTREITHALEKAYSYLATCTDTPTAVGDKQGPQGQAADASPKEPAITATVFQHEIGVLQRTSGEHRRPPATLPGPNTAQGSGQRGGRV
ncbi:DUF5133 domain-containing protein [Streptomyces sp. NPDC127036]|uniref:DUF5133 domain-containing protein n=1 Tax=unclassified Streptomyces TaxID=2593676 RepID=UPI0036469860